MKKMLAICLTVAMLLTALPVAAFMFGSTQALAADSGSGQVQKGWVQVPMDEDGNNGGEAGQMVLGLTFDSINGKLGFFGTDVAGIYRTKDGGDTWELATLGLSSKGATGFAIDPKNKNHVLCVGANGSVSLDNTVHYSVNGGDTWAKAKVVDGDGNNEAATLGFRDKRTQFAFDVSNKDETSCQTVYWSRESDVVDKSREYDATTTLATDKIEKNEENVEINLYEEAQNTGLYKSTDGGKNWTKLPDSEKYGGADIALDPTGKYLYVAKQTKDGTGAGLFKLTVDDSGIIETETKQLINDTDKNVYSMSAVVKDDKFTVYATTEKKLYSYTDGDAAATAIVEGTAGTDEKVYLDLAFDGEADKIAARYVPTHLAVSPVNPDNMVLQVDAYYQNIDGVKHHTYDGSQRRNYYSNDGGATWTKSTRPTDNREKPAGSGATFAVGHFMPTSTMIADFAWSPVEANTVFTCWKHIVKSTDGGATYNWSNAGYAAIYASGYARFNVNYPKLISISSQDYNGALSTDGGKTWKYMDWTGNSWGGYTYGSYALTDKIIWTVKSTEWATNQDAKKTLVVTYDGGKTFYTFDGKDSQNVASAYRSKKNGQSNEGVEVNGDSIGMGVPEKNNIGFMGEWRTTDSGETWTKMLDGEGKVACRGVYTYAKLGDGTYRLFGRNDNAQIVYSNDDGETWTVLANYLSETALKNGEMDSTHKDYFRFDMTYNSKTNEVYVVDGRHLMAFKIDGVEYDKTKLTSDDYDTSKAYLNDSVARKSSTANGYGLESENVTKTSYPCNYVAYDAVADEVYVSTGHIGRSCFKATPTTNNSKFKFESVTSYIDSNNNVVGNPVGPRGITSMTVRYNEVTQSNELFCFTSCYGVWKYGAEQIPEKDTINESLLPTPETDPDAPNITGASISVGESLSLNAYIDATNDAIAEKYTAKFTRYGENGTTTDTAKFVNKDGKYRATFDAIAPQCMGDTIVIELVNDKNKTVKVEWTTVRNNLLGVMEKAETPELYSLCKETLAYGAAAQKYKNYKTDALVDRGLVNLSEFNKNSLTDVEIEKEGNGFKWKSASMFFNNANSFKIKFTSTDDNATGYTVTCKSDDGTTSIDCTITSVGEGVYLIETDLISAVDLSKVYTFTVKNASGVEVGKLTYSVKSYAIAMAAKDNNADMTALAQRLYLYGVSAAEYDKSLNP